MADCKQKEQKCAFGPFAQYGRTRGCDQHQKINLKLALENAADRFAQSKIAAKAIRGEQK